MNTYQSLLNKFNNSLANERFVKEPIQLYEPIDYTLSLGGKRLRPVLMLMAADMFGCTPDRAIYPAIGVEIFHNFTLVHDDIMDNAPIRRGKPSVYKKWNPNTAILSGDTMFVMAYEYISRVEKDLLPEILAVFTSTAKEVCEGQQYDMDFESIEKVSIQDYLEMIRLKTAVLLAASLKIGAIISRTTKDNIDSIYHCGINMGMAFQLMDDLLDTFSDPEKFGKKTGGDIMEGKKTFLYLKALELADSSLKEELLRQYKNTCEPEQKIRDIVGIFNQLNIEEITREKVQFYSAQAAGLLQELDIPDTSKENLKAIIHEMTQRDY
ncbi:MAG: polyprenyl synthetase family protein [Bacteroidales bacterium]|nr:polyprenyl synthetase family protein [Bacteroidales bacterium]MCF8386485.1 polyprenyl synthetase family protein [Bacteroidales bacterium]MCF8399399.1 polyprenyl synthetase family protein [Bacteroidales bacterium]